MIKKVLLACCFIFLLQGFFPVQAGEKETLFNGLLELATHNDPEAQYHVGMMYNNGIGVKQDYGQAFGWFEKSAKSAFPLAQYKLGCYYAGQGGMVTKDIDKALEYKILAAKAGYMLAQNDVATIYFTDKKNMVEAFKWVKAAADQGDAKSLYNVSMFYKDGTAGKKNPVNAYAYFKLAQLVARGEVNNNAKEALNEISKNMTKAELDQAEAIFSGWKASPTKLTLEARQGIAQAQTYLDGKKN